jgi:hypothetical protein
VAAADTRRRSFSLGEQLAIAACAATVALLAVRGLGDRSLWRDEGLSAVAATGSFGEFRADVRFEPQFALYNGLLRGWAVFGSSEFMLRLMSLVFAVATVPVVYAIARRLFGKRVAVIAAALLTLNRLFLGYAREARPYAFALLLVSVATLCLLRALDKPDDGSHWSIWVLTAAAAALSHPFVGGTAVFAHIAVLIARRRSIPWRTIVVRAALPATVVGAAWLFMFHFGTAQLDWIPPNTLKGALYVGYSLVGDTKRLVVGYALGLVVLAVTAVRSDDARTYRLATNSAMVACFFITPFAVAIMASTVQPLLIDRYFIAMVPPLVILVAAGLGQLRPTSAILATTAVLALSIPTALSVQVSPKQDWRSAAAIIVASARQDDVVVGAPVGIAALRYYLDRAGRPSPLAMDGDPFLEQKLGRAQPCHLGVVWIIGDRVESGEPVRRFLAATHEVVRSVALEGLTVLRLERRATAGPTRPIAESCS